MKINSNSQLLASLTSFADPSVKQQQQSIQDKINEQNQQKQQQSTKEVERQDRINANRQALRTTQQKLKANNLDKLKAEFAVAEGEEAEGQGVNLNLRESLGEDRQGPTFKKIGQIVDISI